MPEQLIPSRHLRVGRSRTGLGLFTQVPIKKGQYIIRYRGVKLRNDVADERDNRFMFELNARWTIDGSNRNNIARYINHACRPNSEVYFVKHVIKIRAIKNIKAGAELSYHYGRDYVDIFIKPVGCKCDTCRRKRRLLRLNGGKKHRKR